MVVRRQLVGVGAVVACLITGVAPGATASAAHSLASPRSCAPAADSYGFGPSALLSIEFSSLATGWAVGGNRVLRTTDGGAHWSVVYRQARAQLAQIDGYDDAHAWVLGRDALLATADGGRTWHQLADPCLRAVNFFSTTNGVAVAGKTLVRTSDGGRHWSSALTSPRPVTSACFTDRSHGWLGADGMIYRTADGGDSWRLNVAGPRRSKAQRRESLALVECSGIDSGWAELVGPGAAMNQEPHIGYRLSSTGSRPLFEEGYFPYPGLPKNLPSSPGPYFAAFSSVSPSVAAFVDFCSPCGYGRSSVAVFDGDRLGPDHVVRNIVGVQGAAFLSASNGWVVGETSQVSRHPHWRIVHTTDGGKTWTTQYQT